MFSVIVEVHWTPITIALVLALSLLARFIFIRRKARKLTATKRHLQNQVFLLTGSSRGIGEQLAYQLAEQKATLVLPVRDLDRCQPIVDKCKELGSPRVVAIKYDASDRDSCLSVVRDAEAMEGRLDGVILNHATSVFEPFFKMDEEKRVELIRSTMEANYFGFTNIALAALPHLQKTADSNNKKSNMVIVGSLVGRFASPYVHAYSASKHAIDGFFNCLRHELAMVPDNRIVITNCVLGAIKTQNFMDVVSKYAGSILPTAVSPESTAQRIVEAFFVEEEQFYYPSYIQTQYIINAVSHSLGMRITRLAHGIF